MNILAIDMPTLLKLLAIGNLAILFVLIVSTNEYAIKQSYFSFIVGKVFQGCGWALLALRGTIPIFYSVYIGNIVLIIGMSLDAHGLISIEEFKRHRFFYYMILASIFSVVFLFFAKLANQYILIASLFGALIYLSVSVQVLHVKKITKIRFLLSGINAIAGMLLIVRGIAAIRNTDFKLFSDNFIQEVSFSSIYILLILSGTGFILLKKERVARMLAESMRELEKLARVDSLTGLMNRRSMDEYLRFSISENRRRKEPIAILMIDIDFFKNYNDLYGHVAGDACLCAVAAEIRKYCARATDLAARFGGEEFTIIMWNLNEAKALLVANDIREGIANLGIEHRDSEVSTVVTVSLGVFSTVPETDDNNDDWYIQQADKYLYQAKRTGRNKCCSASASVQTAGI